MDKNNVIIVGAFNEIIELCNDCGVSIIGIIDNQIKETFRGIPIIGSDMDAEKLFSKYKNNPLILTPDSPQIRKKLYNLYSSIGYSFRNLISPKSYVSPSATIGIGTVVQSGVYISSNSKIGDFCKLNVQSLVMHDNVVGDFVTIAPRAVCLGRVQIDKFAYLGSNSTILPNIYVGESSIVGAGAVVTKNISSNNVMIGVPAKQLNKS